MRDVYAPQCKVVHALCMKCRTHVYPERLTLSCTFCTMGLCAACLVCWIGANHNLCIAGALLCMQSYAQSSVQS